MQNPYDEQIGLQKAHDVAVEIRALHPDITVEVVRTRADAESLIPRLKRYDVVIVADEPDCCLVLLHPQT